MKYWMKFAVAVLLLCGAVRATDEAERQVWLFRNAGEALAWGALGENVNAATGALTAAYFST